MTVISARPCSRAAVGRATPRWLVAFRLLLYAGLVLAAVWGGPVVRVAAICAIPLALLVDWEGGTRHILRMGGIALAIWLAPQFGGRLADMVSVHWGLSPAISNVAGIGLIGILIIATGAVLARLASRRIRRRRLSRAFDHVLGGLLGTAEAGLAVACGCWMLAALAGPLASVQARISRNLQGAVAVAPPEASMAANGAAGVTRPTHLQAGAQKSAAQQQVAGAQPQPAAEPQAVPGAQQIRQRILSALCDINVAVRDDPAGQWLLQRNALEKLTPVRTAGLMLEVAADPGALLAALDSGRLDAVASLPEVRRYTEAIQRDPQLRDALQRQDFAAVLSHPLVKSMLMDSELRRALLDNVDKLRQALAIDEVPVAKRLASP